MTRASILLAILLIGFRNTPAADPPNVADDHPQRMKLGLKLFRDHVRTILTQHCIECHNRDDARGGLNLTSRKSLLNGGESGAVVIPGKPERSRLWQLISHTAEPHMPLDGPKLPAASLKAIRDWIENEAPYDGPIEGDQASSRFMITEDDRRFWSFQPLRRPSLPAVAAIDWCENAIDRFLLAGVEAKGLPAVGQARRIRLIRRLKLDLCGLPPTPSEVDAFISDEQFDAWPQLVNRFLASPQHGERYARHWLDVVRFAESYGFEHDLDNPNAWHYRDFVIRALNDNMPFDQFVQWQIAGDELSPDDPLAWMATGFLAAGVRNADIAKVRVEQERYDELDDIASTVGSAMLGLSIGCARCHDHKFDPIPQRDYYRFIATFERTIRGEVELAVTTGQPPVKVLVASEGITPLPRIYNPPPAFYESTWFLRRGDASLKVAQVRPGTLQILNPAGAKTDLAGANLDGALAKSQKTYRRSQLARWLTDVDDGAGALLARVLVNRLWQQHFGRGIVDTPNDFGRRGAPPTHPRLLDWLASDLVDSGWNVRHIHRLILTSAAWRQSVLKTRSPSDTRLFRGRRVQRLEAEAIRDSMLSASGRLTTQLFGPGTLNSAHDRRSIYFRVKRSQLVPMMMLFDAPDPLQSIGQRTETTVAPQALALMNAASIRKLASDFATSLLKESKFQLSVAAVEQSEPQAVSSTGASLPSARATHPQESPGDLVDLAYRRTLSRPPSEQERNTSIAFLQAQQAEYNVLAKRVAEAPAKDARLFHLVATTQPVYRQSLHLDDWPNTLRLPETVRNDDGLFAGISKKKPVLVPRATPLGHPAVRFGPAATIFRSSDARLNFGTSDFSVSVLFRINKSAAEDQHILGKDSYAGAAPYSGYFLQYHRGRLKFCTRRIVSGGGQNAEVLTEPMIEKGRWYRVTGVRQDNELRLYLDDGEAVGSRRETIPIDVDNAAGFKIGAMDEHPGSPFHGSMAEVLIYDKALSSSEVQRCHDYLRQKYLAREIDSPFKLALTDFCQSLFCLNEFIYIE